MVTPMCARISNVLALLLLLSAPAWAAEGKHPFQVEDLSSLHRARAMAVSPDGGTVLFAVSASGEKGPARRDWFLIGLAGENRRKLELPEAFTPQGFMKDGNALYGGFKVDQKKQLAIVPLAPGPATQIIALPNGVISAVLSPDGKQFACLADASPVDPLAGVRTVVRNETASLYVVKADGTGGAWWCPEFADLADLAWSPDGGRIAVIRSVPKIGHHEVRTAILVCEAGQARKVADLANSVSGIAWADAGRDLVFASTETKVLTPDHLWKVAAAGGTPADLTPGLRGSIVGVQNDPHGVVWVTLVKGPTVEIQAFRDGRLEPAYTWPGGSISGPPVGTGLTETPATLAFTVGDPNHCTNVAVASGTGLRRLTTEGDDALAKVDLGEVRVVRWTSRDGVDLEGILTLPAGYESRRKYKFLVLPHGGPEASDALELDIFARLVAGCSYVVLQPQYRGSTGYGSAFLDAIYQHFGDRAYADVESATDFAIAQGWADPTRLAIFGWSAGGFMTSWTVTQTQRYKAAVEGAGITDWLSFIPTSDIAQVDYDQRLHEADPAPFLRFSAVMFADRVTTPLLILHGEGDLRVPTFQGREFFVLLAERGKTVRMVTYPGSPHFPVLAEQVRNVFEELRDWLAKYNP
jgi:dipeptidyl aminopeptidase/acylaminoacyl peptidase